MFSKKLSTRTNAYLSVATLVVSLTVVGIVSELYFHQRLDLTQNREFTLSKAAVNTLENLPDLVTIKVVMSKDLPSQFVQVRTHAVDLLNEFQAQSKGKLNLVFEDPGQSEEKRTQVTSLGIQEVQLQEQSAQGMEIKKGFFGLAMIYGDKKEVIPVLQNLETFEYDLIIKLKKLTGTVKNIGILEGSGENKFSFTLPGPQPKTTLGFDENYPSLKEEISKLYNLVKLDPINKPIPDSINLVLVVAPARLLETEQFHLDQYIMKGKSVIFLTPGVDVNLVSGLAGGASHNGYEELLTHYGLGVKKNVLLESQYLQMVRFGDAFFPTPYPYWVVLTYNTLNKTNPVTSKLQSISFPWVSSIVLDSVSKDSSDVQVLASSSKDSWEETGGFSFIPKDLKDYLPINPKSYPVVVLKTGKMKSFFAHHPIPKDSVNPIDTNTVIKDGKAPSRLLVVSNALFATDFYVGYTNSVGNINLMLNAVDLMVLDQDLINVRSRQISSSPIDEAKKSTARLPTILVNMVLAPVLLLALGIFFGIRRRKKEAGV